MNLKLFFDTETTGLPVWSQPSGDECQPHIVQLAASLVDADARKVIQTIDVIIKPDGWEIPADSSAIHGITTEYAMDVGVSELLAVDMLLGLLGDRERIAYNQQFDERIIRIALKRYDFREDVIDSWRSGRKDCAMKLSRAAIGGKNPTLSAAYEHFTGKPLDGAHSAITDTNACMDVYFAALDAASEAA